MRLRTLGFGYRAKYIDKTAVMLTTRNDASGPNEYLQSLCAPHASYRDAREALLAFQGVGPKVADCVCLMALGHTQVITRV
jgi:N-glycosylase/DNA lyase